MLPTSQNISSSITELNLEKVKDIKLTTQKENLKIQRRIDTSEKMEIIILGFSLYNINNSEVSINYYFAIANNNDINFRFLNFSSYIVYNNSVTGEISNQTKDVSCIFENTKINNKYKIPCSVQLDNNSFIEIGAKHEFKYEPDNFEVIGITPLINLYLNDLNIVNLLNSSDQRIYILEHSLCNTNITKNNFFNISGIMNETNLNITYTDLIFYANDLYEEPVIHQFNCSIINESNSNFYTLNCEKNENLNIDLQSAVSFVNDIGDILLINFDRNTVSTTDIVTNSITNRIIVTNKCSGVDFFNGVCTPDDIPDSTDIIESDYIYDILDDIENGEFDEIFDNAINENKTYNGTENNITYTISTISSQYSTNYSTVALEDCESLLKEKYSLDKNEKLILLKLEYDIEELKIPIIEYQLFLKNGTRVNLSYCNNIPEIVSIPVEINEKEEFIHNPKSDFYDDQCYAYTTEYYTDLTMYDRKNNYNEKYLSLCEKNCEYRGYNREKKRVECECTNKAIFPELVDKAKKESISKELNLKELIHQFGDVIKHWNLFLFKCYKQVFSSNGLKKNSASYINIIIISIVIFCTIFFIISGYTLYKNRIKDIMNKKFNDNNLNDTEKDLNNKDTNNPNDIRKINKTNDTNNNNNINFASSFESSFNLSFTKHFNDFEMNNLKYNQAIELDKRTFCQMYVSFIKTKQPIYFTFFLCNDYNSRIIKICLFLFSFPLEYAINALFFNDSTMHKIYEDRGDYNLIYLLPQIIYSFLISFAITKLLGLFILPEKKISKIIELKNPGTEIKINDFFKKSIYKLVIFFILILLFLLLFFYYLAAFCAVYKNTQGALFKDTIISFAISLFIHSYIFCLIFCGMRYCSLRMKNKCKICLYNASDILSDIFL